MANQFVIKGNMKVSNEIVAENVQNTSYALPSTIGTEGQILQVVGGIPTWVDATSGSDNDGIVGPFEYAYNHSSPITLMTALNGMRITEIVVEITQQFSDSLATLIVGDSLNTSRLLSANQTDLGATVGQIFQVTPTYVYDGTAPVILTLDPATSNAGSFKITLSYMQ